MSYYLPYHIVNLFHHIEPVRPITRLIDSSTMQTNDMKRFPYPTNVFKIPIFVLAVQKLSNSFPPFIFSVIRLKNARKILISTRPSSSPVRKNYQHTLIMLMVTLILVQMMQASAMIYTLVHLYDRLWRCNKIEQPTFSS